MTDAVSTGTTGTGTGVTTTADPLVGQQTGTESSLSNWAGDYVTNMLGKGQALANAPYQAYTGPLTAGSSNLQDQAFSGLAGLTIPTDQMGTYTPGSFTDTGVAQKYMNPYIQASLDPQIAEARRQAEISRIADAGRLTKAGAYGGSRQAIMESEGNRNLGTNLANITGQGYKTAYDLAANQFNTEQGRGQSAQEMTNTYGLNALRNQAELGAVQRGIESEGIAADKAQFEEQRDWPYKMAQYQKDLLQGLPITTNATTNNTTEIGNITNQIKGLMGLYQSLAGLGQTTPTTPAP